MSSTYYYCQILITFGFSRHICKKFSNINFHESRVVPRRRTDRRAYRKRDRQTDGYEEKLIISLNEIDKAPHDITYFLAINTVHISENFCEWILFLPLNWILCLFLEVYPECSLFYTVFVIHNVQKPARRLHFQNSGLNDVHECSYILSFLKKWTASAKESQLTIGLIGNKYSNPFPYSTTSSVKFRYHVR
jgi:hypothetical protein